MKRNGTTKKGLLGSYLLHLYCLLSKGETRAGEGGLVFPRPNWANGPHRFPGPRILIVTSLAASVTTKRNERRQSFSLIDMILIQFNDIKNGTKMKCLVYYSLVKIT